MNISLVTRTPRFSRIFFAQVGLNATLIIHLLHRSNMALRTIIISFAVSISFRIFLNTFDVYSDIALSTNTLTFNLGDSFLLSGCKVCNGKEDKEIFSVNKSTCDQCLMTNYAYECGLSFQILDKLKAFEKSDKCDFEGFGAFYNFSSRSFDWTNETCHDDGRTTCCAYPRQKTTTSYQKHPLDQIDKRILAVQNAILKNMRWVYGYDVYILTGQMNRMYCEKMFWNYFGWSSRSKLKYFFQNVTNHVAYQNVNKLNHSDFFFKFIRSPENKTVIKEGFDVNDECGIYVFRKHQYQKNNNGENCGSDSCLIHFQYLKTSQNITNLNDWKDKTFFNLGIKSGGKTCQNLWLYGISSLVPILLNLTFHLFVYLDDLKSEKSSMWEIAFVLIQFYPQWKTMKFLVRFIKNRDEIRLNEEMDDIDLRIGSIEPFIESAFQVSLNFRFLIWY